MILKLLLNTQMIWMMFIKIQSKCKENRLEYNKNENWKTLIVFDNIIADMLINKTFNPIVTELLIRGRKPKISLVFITQSYFAVPKNIRLDSTHYFIMKIPNKRELQ